MATSITLKTLREGAASDAGLRVAITGISSADIDANNKTLNLPQLFQKVPDSFHLADAFITYNGVDYARILKFHSQDAPYKVTVDRIPTGLTGTGSATTASVYFLLSPEDWNDCINNALEALHRPVRFSLTIVAGQNDYSMDTLTDGDGDLGTWLQSRTQIYALEYRSLHGSVSSLEQLGGVRFIEANNSITVHLNMEPSDTDSSLVLVARKPYVWRGKLLDDDADLTKCPFLLAMNSVQIKAYQLLFKRHGERMKAQFAAALAISEKKQVQLLNEYVPAMRPQPLLVDEVFQQEIPAGMIVWPW